MLCTVGETLLGFEAGAGRGEREAAGMRTFICYFSVLCCIFLIDFTFFAISLFYVASFSLILLIIVLFVYSRLCCF